ncbi:MAG: carbohydrate ABC transporter permease [Anaerolineae bacterium]|nr:carbohydrate ABC transporter permease [Anaerolineae bacterium]
MASLPQPQTVAFPFRRKPASVRLWALTGGLLVFTVVVGFPFVWMLALSFRNTTEILADPFGLPVPFRAKNYVTLFTDPQIDIFRYVLNSIIVTGGSLILSTMLSALAGYGFARRRFRFRGRELLFGMMFISIMFPAQISLIAQFQQMVSYKIIPQFEMVAGQLQITGWTSLYNNLLSLVLLYSATRLPISVFLLRTFYAQIPQDLEDAARIDGCNDWSMFWRVMFPISRPALATILIFNFIYCWNEFLYAIVMVPTRSSRTLPLAIFNFLGENRSDYALGAASLVASTLPVLLLYLFLSERFIEGMTAGAVKG